MMSVRGNTDSFDALAASGLSVDPMTLQNIFVALCGDAKAEG